jgi:hypothetical protein
MRRQTRQLFFRKTMNTSSSLTGVHRRTYEAIFRHPAAHNLAWHDVRAMLAHLGTVDSESNGHLKVTRNGHTLTLHLPHAKEVTEMSHLTELRHFLTRSETAAAADSDAHWLMVIDHQQARLYRSEMRDSVPQKVVPHSAHGHSLRTRQTLEFSRGQEKPDPAVFFSTVANALGDSAKVLVFGCGHGHSSEMDQFLTWATLHRQSLAQRIIGSVVVDEKHNTPGQLLARAREFYAQVPVARLA